MSLPADASRSSLADDAMIYPSSLVIGANVQCIYTGSSNQLVDMRTHEDGVGDALHTYITLSADTFELGVDYRFMARERTRESRAFSLKYCTHITLERNASLRFEWSNSIDAKYRLERANVEVSAENRVLTITLRSSAKLLYLPTLCPELCVEFSGDCELSGRASFAQLENIQRFTHVAMRELPADAPLPNRLVMSELQVNAQIRVPVFPSRGLFSRRRTADVRDNGSSSSSSSASRRVRSRLYPLSTVETAADDDFVGGPSSFVVPPPEDIRDIIRQVMLTVYDQLPESLVMTSGTQDERDTQNLHTDPLGVWRSRLERQCERIFALHKLKGFLRRGQGAEALKLYSVEDDICLHARAHVEDQHADDQQAEDKAIETMNTTLAGLQQSLSALSERELDAPPLQEASDTTAECVVCQDAHGLFSVCDRCSDDKVLCEQCLDNCVLFNCIKTCITCRGLLRETARVVTLKKGA